MTMSLNMIVFNVILYAIPCICSCNFTKPTILYIQCIHTGDGCVYVPMTNQSNEIYLCQLNVSLFVCLSV